MRPTGDEALERLLEGNRRFASGSPLHPGRDEERRAELAQGQAPFAIVVCCSDSRVPPEVIFDAELGELFVVRVAGNTMSEPIIRGSAEFAATQLGSSLLVVLGHEFCGAVKGAVAAVAGDAITTGSIQDVVHPIVPAVERALESDPGLSGDELVAAAVRANVRQTVESLAAGDGPLRELVEEGSLKVAGAEYRLATGEVELL